MTERIGETMQKDLDKEPVCCETVEVHEDLLRIVEQTMPEETELYDLAELFKGLGIPPAYGYCLCFLRRKYVCVIWRECLI